MKWKKVSFFARVFHKDITFQVQNIPLINPVRKTCVVENSFDKRLEPYPMKLVVHWWSQGRRFLWTFRCVSQFCKEKFQFQMFSTGVLKVKELSVTTCVILFQWIVPHFYANLLSINYIKIQFIIYVNIQSSFQFSTHELSLQPVKT